MNKQEGGTFTLPKASQYVESTLSYVGHVRYTTGYLPHSLMTVIGQFITFVAPAFVEARMTKNMLAVRDKVIKRGSYKN